MCIHKACSIRQGHVFINVYSLNDCVDSDSCVLSLVVSSVCIVVIVKLLHEVLK